MTFFTMRWQGPLMSLTGARIDGFAQPVPIPPRSMVAGMLGAALGLPMCDPALDTLWKTIRHGVVVHQAGVPVTDFQTADLTLMPDKMWWFDGKRYGVMMREGATASLLRRTQERTLLSDADMTVVVEVMDDSHWTAEQMLGALRRPRFPLYLGRSNCLPAARVAGQVLDAGSLVEAIQGVGDGTVYLPVEVDGDFTLGDVMVRIPERNRGESVFKVNQHVT